MTLSRSGIVKLRLRLKAFKKNRLVFIVDDSKDSDDEVEDTRTKLALLERFYCGLMTPYEGDAIHAIWDYRTRITLAGGMTDLENLVGCMCTVRAKTQVYSYSGAQAWKFVAVSIEAD